MRRRAVCAGAQQLGLGHGGGLYRGAQHPYPWGDRESVGQGLRRARGKVESARRWFVDT